jgi:outer membrane receptor protein involved in Fe transport
MGGLLKYVTKRPDATSLGVDAQTGIAGTRDGTISYNGASAVNTPIVADKMALRASTFYSRDSGYITNRALDEDGVGRSDIYGGRADVLFTPSEALNIRMTAFLQNISRDGQATADYDFTGSPLNGRLEQSRRTAEPFDQHFRLISGIVNYELGSSKLTSISSYQTMRADSFLDVSAAYVPLLELFFGRSYSAVGVPVELGTDKFVQEVRLASEGNRPLEWLIGGFYTHESSKNKQALALRDPSGQLALNDLLTFSAPSQYDEYAAFGNLTWHLTSQLNLSGGVRYAENDQKFTQFGSGILGSSLPTNRAKENVFTYLANARYQFGDHATGYLRYATGYRPGGPNYVTIDPTTGLPVGAATFESDSLKSYEIGFKAETGDRRFGVDLAGYYIDWSNIQIQVIRGGLGAIANAPGGASVRGAELALTARPTGDFVLSGALAYQDAYMNEADPPVLPDFPAGRDLKNRKGERLPNVPRLTAALNADYSLAVGSLQPTIGATFRYVSERRASFDNNTSFPQYHLPDYTTLDLRTSLNLERFNVQLYVRNLFDERGELSAMHANFGTARVSILQPRTVGVSLTTHF